MIGAIFAQAAHAAWRRPRPIVAQGALPRVKPPLAVPRQRQPRRHATAQRPRRIARNQVPTRAGTGSTSAVCASLRSREGV
jgi:hypothetical protein